jgi:hypothetical protein
MSKKMQGGVLYINGRPAAHAGPGGHACAEEECWVTVGGARVKQVFTNIAHSDDLQGCTQLNFVNGYPLATKASFTSVSYGDESSEGGVVSGTVSGQARFFSSSNNVRLEGQFAVRHGDSVMSNNGNTEMTTWVQPAKGATAIAQLCSDPIENLPDPAALNIQLIRHPSYEFEPSGIQQHFLVEHDQTGHKTYHTFGVFKNIQDTYLWHEDIFREGSYSVHEIFSKGGMEIIKIPLGKIKTVTKTDTSPGMKLVPLKFLRHDDLQRSVEGAKAPYASTHIYLFKDGYLWRELDINALGLINEVDLPKFKTKTLRYSNAELSQGILLPIEDAEGKHTFHIAVSHLRWSWRTIHLMGGFDPKDTRFGLDQRMHIEPDQALIKKRLQCIDIHQLVNHGSNFSTIDTSQTEDEFLRQFHTKEPPPSNWMWVVDRDKIKHSQGTTQAAHDIYWDEGKNKNTVNGTAVILLDDPLGRLIQTSELIVDERCKYQAYMEKFSEVYVVAQLVGKVIETNTEIINPYEKMINNHTRLKFMTEFEEMRDSREAFVTETTELLKCWFDASHARGQWDDFYCNGLDKADIPATSLRYKNIQQNVQAAFTSSEKAMDYLREEIKKSDSLIEKGNEQVANWLALEYSASLFQNTMNQMAALLEPNEASLQKLLAFYQKSTHEPLNARFVPIPESQLFAHHQEAMHASDAKPSLTLRVNNGLVSPISPAIAGLTSPKMVTVLEFEGEPIYKTQVLVESLKRPLSEEHATWIKKIAIKVGTGAPLRTGLTALVIFNTRHTIAEIDRRKTLGDIDSGTLTVLHGEILRSALTAAELGIGAAGMMTKLISNKQLTEGAMRIAERMTIPVLIVGAIIDVWHIFSYSKTGEDELTYSHALSILGAMTVMAALAFATAHAAMILLGGFGFLLMTIASLSILYFTKSEMESWLFKSYFGLTASDKNSPKHSIEKFHCMVTLVRILKIGGRNEALNLNVENGRRWYTKPPAPVTELSWTLIAPEDSQMDLKIRIYAQTPDGYELLKDKLIKVKPLIPTESNLGWEVLAPRRCFPANGDLGKILIECFDSRSGGFLGKDAYVFHYRDIPNDYEHSKVLYEFNH